MRQPLTFDPDAVLGRDSGILLDPRFLGAIHAELEQLEGEQAHGALLQIGFLHGLRDAARAVGASLQAHEAGSALTSPIPLRFRRDASAAMDGAIELVGSWMGQDEAMAHLQRVGASSSGACWISAGYTSGWLSGIFDADILALETGCAAAGADHCHFRAREAERWRGAGDAAAQSALEALPFDSLREAVAQHDASSSQMGVSSEEPVVHIWGPVMVIPFSGVDEALMALDLLGRDAEASRVSVIVIDLTGAIVDEAFGASALEQILESVDGWGVESILAGVSPLSEQAVAGLDRQPLMVLKDLHGAIAAAFQIADTRGHTA